MLGAKGMRRLALMGGVIAVACCGVTAAAMAHDKFVVAWKRQLGKADNDSARGVATDAAGNVFITGWTAGSLGGPKGGGFDAWVVKFSETGGTH